MTAHGTNKTGQDRQYLNNKWTNEYKEYSLYVTNLPNTTIEQDMIY